VRGFLAGVVRKKLGLTLQSDKTEGERVYRVIRTGEGAKPQAAWAPRRSSAQQVRGEVLWDRPGEQCSPAPAQCIACTCLICAAMAAASPNSNGRLSKGLCDAGIARARVGRKPKRRKTLNHATHDPRTVVLTTRRAAVTY
jgi:hypothetical protein